MLSMLDIYAVCMLASGNAPSFVTLPNGMENKKFDARMFATPGESPQIEVPEYAPSSTSSPLLPQLIERTLLSS
jgi:hypothetical protein